MPGMTTEWETTSWRGYFVSCGVLGLKGRLRKARRKIRITIEQTRDLIDRMNDQIVGVVVRPK